MRFLRKKRALLAVLFQSVFLFFILTSANTEDLKTIRSTHAPAKTLLCISPGSTLVVRETSEQFSPTLSVVKDYSILEKIWLCAERVKILELLTNPALRVSTSLYNTFYILITIHAP